MKVKLSDSNNESLLFFSYEWLPSSKHEDFNSLVKRIIECSKEFKPLFCAIPYHNISFPIKNSSALKLAIELQSQEQDVLFHLTCQSLTKDSALEILKELKEKGIKNIFALRGDTSKSNISQESCFQYAKDLVQFIKSEFGSYFTICVAGYPSRHPDSCDKAEELKHLREKVDAGADFIITQIVFDAIEFVEFVKDCRYVGIQVPIIPGIVPVQDFEMAERISKKCCITIPNSLRCKYFELCNKRKEFEDFVIRSTVDIIKSIIHSGIDVPGVHLFTFNRPEMCLQIQKEVYNTVLTSKRYI